MAISPDMARAFLPGAGRKPENKGGEWPKPYQQTLDIFSRNALIIPVRLEEDAYDSSVVAIGIDCLDPDIERDMDRFITAYTNAGLGKRESFGMSARQDVSRLFMGSGKLSLQDEGMVVSKPLQKHWVFAPENEVRNRVDTCALAHRREVEKAIAAGLDVPAAVLQEYNKESSRRETAGESQQDSIGETMRAGA